MAVLIKAFLTKICLWNFCLRRSRLYLWIILNLFTILRIRRQRIQSFYDKTIRLRIQDYGYHAMPVRIARNKFVGSVLRCSKFGSSILHKFSELFWIKYRNSLSIICQSGSKINSCKRWQAYLWHLLFTNELPVIKMFWWFVTIPHFII